MIQIFTGPMYASKSLQLIRVYQNIEDKQSILCFKPSIDIRDLAIIKSRDSFIELEAILIENLSEIKQHINRNTKVILIDEAQFLKGSQQELFELSMQGIDIYVAGLALTSEQEPFGIMPNIMAISNKVVHLYARCTDCNNDKGEYTYCITQKNKKIMVGSDQYIALCENCLRKRRGQSN